MTTIVGQSDLSNYYGVFKWRGDGRYSKADCLKWYKRAAAAQDYADTLNAKERTHEGYVVRSAKYIVR